MPAIKTAMYWRRLEDGTIECLLCPRHCKFREHGDVGVCGVRMRLGNELKTLVYGKTSGWAIDPVEKKPLFHFFPGHSTFSLGTIGCNFLCRHCQNWFISQARFKRGSLKPPIRLEDLPPEEIVKLARAHNCISISYTYNEPVVFYEYMLDTAKLARKHGIMNIMVTNGYIEEEPLSELAKYIDAANVDLKGDKRFYKEVCRADPGPEVVMRTIEELHRRGVHVEVTCLIIPGWNDTDEFFRSVAKWVYETFGPDAVPLHFTAFYPAYQMQDRDPTPPQTLIRAREIAMKEFGLHYVYTGNIPWLEGEHTYCPECGRVVIRRYGFYIEEWNLDEHNRCKFCGAQIRITGRYSPNRSWVVFHMLY